MWNKGYPHNIHNIQSLYTYIIITISDCLPVVRTWAVSASRVYLPYILMGRHTLHWLSWAPSCECGHHACQTEGWSRNPPVLWGELQLASHKDTHTLTVHQKRVWWHQPKSLGLWWCWTVTIITFTCTFTFSSYYTFTCRTMGFCWGVKWMSLLRWNYTTLQFHWLLSKPKKLGLC